MNLHQRVEKLPCEAEDLAHWERDGIVAVAAGIALFEEDSIGLQSANQEKKFARDKAEMDRKMRRTKS